MRKYTQTKGHNQILKAHTTFCGNEKRFTAIMISIHV